MLRCRMRASDNEMRMNKWLIRKTKDIGWTSKRFFNCKKGKSTKFVKSQNDFTYVRGTTPKVLSVIGNARNQGNC